MLMAVIYYYVMHSSSPSKYTTQNLISINVLFSMKYSVTHPEFDSNLMTMSDENACRSDLLFFDNALKSVTT